MKITSKQRRKFRIRKKVVGLATGPRLSIYKSLTSIYAQIINDEEGCTLAASSIRGKKKMSPPLKSSDKR